MNVPGYAEAIVLGYSLMSSSFDKTTAWYSKTVYPDKVLNLTVFTVNDELNCEVSSIYKMISITTGNIAFPHKNIQLFESQVLKCIPIGE